jgi:hypothetical protein
MAKAAGIRRDPVAAVIALNREGSGAGLCALGD